MQLSPSAHVDTFCRDNLPPADQWPDLRFDLPTIGARTIEGAREAALAGIAVAAGVTQIVDPQGVIAAADGPGLFVTGFAA